MVSWQALKIQQLSFLRVIYLLFLVFFWCPELWAQQDAMVTADRAVIFSDREMTSPVGYILKGRRVRVGEIPRNKAQVYPIIVSGKIAYIRVLDVTSERESMESNRLVAERFQRSTEQDYHGKFVLSYYNFSSRISMDKSNSTIVNNDQLQWKGISLKGELLLKERWDFQVVSNYMQAEQVDETFRAFEFGLGGAYRVMNFRSFLLRLEAQVLAIPFSNYELQGKFRLNSYGFTTGGGINATYLFNEHWGLETYAGLYYTKTFGFDTPDQYNSVAPSFYGNRLGLGVNYSY